MPLANFVELDQPITTAMLIECSSGVFSTLDEVEAGAGGTL